mgnify:CR=1 FL=1
MKNKEKSTMTAVLLLSVLLIIVVYMFVYKSYADKTKALQTSNSTLQARVNELKVYYDDKETYEQGIKEFTTDIKNKLSVFPGNSREEDALDLAITPWKNGVLVDYQQIAIGEATEVSSIPEDVVKNRFDRLLAEVQKISAEKAGVLTGQTLPVLIEEQNDHDAHLVTGRLSNNAVVHLPGSVDLIGSIRNVKLLECKGFYYMGELVS